MDIAAAEEKLAKLEDAALNGVLSFDIGDRRTQFQDMDSLINAISLLKRSIARAKGRSTTGIMTWQGTKS